MHSIMIIINSVENEMRVNKLSTVNTSLKVYSIKHIYSIQKVTIHSAVKNKNKFLNW